MLQEADVQRQPKPAAKLVGDRQRGLSGGPTRLTPSLSKTSRGNARHVLASRPRESGDWSLWLSWRPCNFGVPSVSAPSGLSYDLWRKKKCLVGVWLDLSLSMLQVVDLVSVGDVPIAGDLVAASAD